MWFETIRHPSVERRNGIVGESNQRVSKSIFDAIIVAATGLGEVVVQARKTYFSLVSRRRTFARVQPTTKNRVDLGLRLEGRKPCGRLQPSKIHDTKKLQITLTAADEVDAEVLDWLQRAFRRKLPVSHFDGASRRHLAHSCVPIMGAYLEYSVNGGVLVST